MNKNHWMNNEHTASPIKLKSMMEWFEEIKNGGNNMGFKVGGFEFEKVKDGIKIIEGDDYNGSTTFLSDDDWISIIAEMSYKKYDRADIVLLSKAERFHKGEE